MDSVKIVKRLKEKEFSPVLSDLKILTACENKIDCSEICYILKALYQAVVPSSVELENESAKSVIADMIPCFQMCIKYAEENYSCSDLVNNEFFPILYHIIRTFIKAELYDYALSCTETLKKFLKNPQNGFEDKITYIKNMSIIFWNDALQFEASGDTKDFDMALKLRTISIEFLLLHDHYVDNANEKITIALVRYCQSNINFDIKKLEAFLKNMWDHLGSFSKTYEHIVNLYKTLQNWYEIMLKFLNETGNIIFKHFLEWFQDISKLYKKKEQKIVTICSNLSRACIQFFILHENHSKFKKTFPSSEDLLRCIKEPNDLDTKILASTCGIVYSSFAKFFRSLRNLENEILLKFLLSNLNCCSLLVSHFINLFSEPSVQRHLTLPLHLCFSTSHTLINAFTILIKKEENVNKRKLLIKEAESFVKYSFSKVRITPEEDNMGRNIIAYASCIARIAMTLYGLGENWYFDSISFFEIADSVFTKCSSFHEYQTEETQVTLWKLHELFVYVCFLTKCHERALEIIAKLLKIHERKIKECFSLWRKVKRDAFHTGNLSILSITVSDMLLKTDLEVGMETEIMYLVEEFKIYRSERYNLDKEIIALSLKILNMQCSDSVRAYILLQILTMSSNISEKIAEILKKSLPEICMEIITLYTSIIAQHSEDYVSKLFLSVAYFWLYQHNIKKIHIMAKEEAQNLLKPPSPKPLAMVQNDIEEENDTCDIQPVHPLVSVAFETEAFKNLNLAIQQWYDIPENKWEELSHIAKEENILDLIQATAEIFSTAVQECEELKLWLLLHSVSIVLKNKYHELFSGISIINFLIKLGYLNVASCLLTEIENNGSIKNAESESIEIKFKLSKSSCFLHLGKFDEGFQILWDILASPVMEKNFKSIRILNAETLILMSDFLQLPTKAFSYSENKQKLVINSPFAVLMKSISICKVLLKYITEKEPSSGYEWIYFKAQLIKNLLKAHILLGELYFKAGDPRFARCFLQEALKLAESHILIYWSSKILLDLAHIDFMCDNFKDCSVKANGLKYIMDPNTKANSFEILNHLLTNNAISNEPLSPDSPDGLIISTVPDIALTRQIKQIYIDKIDVMASPLPKSKLSKNNSNNTFQCNFKDGNFSMNLLQLQSSLLSYLISKTEMGSKSSIDSLQLLINYLNKLKDFKYMNNILSSFKWFSNTKDPFSRFLTKLEISFYVSVQLEKLEFFSTKNDILGAKETVKTTFDFLEKACCANLSYPDIYASLKYHDIRVSLCEFYEIDLNSSVSYYFCQSVFPNMKQKKSFENIVPNTPSTPVNKNRPNIVVTEYKSDTKKCRAPLKKNLLNTNMKQDLGMDVSLQNSPFIVFSSSDETENFESPFNSLTRASKTRSGPKVSKKTDKIDKSSNIHYQIFTQKNTLEVKKSSDIWNLCVTDTPKLGKENKNLRTSRKTSKSSQISKRKINSAASSSKSSKPKNSLKKNVDRSNSLETASTSKYHESSIETDLMSNDSSERKMSIEYSRSSPHDNINEKDLFPKRSMSDKRDDICNSDILLPDNVFYTPSKVTLKGKISLLIDALCEDLSSLNLNKSKGQQIAAGNLDEVINELNELKLLTQNSMPYPLYGDICKLLGILYLIKRDGSWNEEKVLESCFLLSETFSLSLRNVHIGNLIYYKEDELMKNEKVITKILKTLDLHTDDQMKSFLEIIPENWTVIQVSALHNQEYLLATDPIPCPTKFIFAQIRKNSSPVIISTDCSSDERFSSSFLSEFTKILEESHLTMLNNDSKIWWTTRSSLDIRLKDLTRDMENIWLGCWKGLFLGIPQNEERVKQIQDTVDAISKSCEKKNLLKILIDSAQHLSKYQVCAAVCYLWNCNHSDAVHKKLCKPIHQISVALPDSDRHPVIIILDQLVQDLPWECMPILKGVPITRMPSLSLLCSKLHMLEPESVLDRGFNSSKTYYVLNPAGDLTHSQQYFQEKFKKQINWNGSIGVAPCGKDYISGLKDYEFFIYCGHGSGRKYLEGTSVDKQKLQSTSLLMGCSSGKLRRLGRILEAHGIVLRLLLSGCPSITANLWDVTDKDIDRFTEKLLLSLVPNYDDFQCKIYDVAKAVSIARSACKMRYLVGAAPIVYGFPVFAKNQ